jgi:hypothetical protein
MAIVPWKKLIESSETQKDGLLEEKLGITREEIIMVKDDYLSAACLIFEKTLKMGLKKHQALAEITTHTVSALVENDWSKPQTSVRRTSRLIKNDYFVLKNEMFKQSRQEFSNIHFLREEVFQLVKNKEFLVNSINKNGWDVTFSSKDILRGTKLPHKIDGLFSFLLGVYFSIGNPGKQNQFYLNTKKNRIDFLDEIVSSTVLKIFNIKSGVYSNLVNKKSGYNSKIYSFYDHEYSITSKAHQQFIKNYFNFWKNNQPLNHAKRVYKIPELIFDGVYSDLPFKKKIKYFFSGIINSRGNIQSENKSKIMIMIDKNYSYLESIQKICLLNGYNPTLKSKNDSYILRFSKSMLKDLVVNQETPLFYENKNLFEKNLGVFVNSYQIEKLKNFK